MYYFCVRGVAALPGWGLAVGDGRRLKRTCNEQLVQINDRFLANYAQISESKRDRQKRHVQAQRKLCINRNAQK